VSTTADRIATIAGPRIGVFSAPRNPDPNTDPPALPRSAPLPVSHFLNPAPNDLPESLPDFSKDFFTFSPVALTVFSVSAANFLTSAVAFDVPDVTPSPIPAPSAPVFFSVAEALVADSSSLLTAATALTPMSPTKSLMSASRRTFTVRSATGHTACWWTTPDANPVHQRPPRRPPGLPASSSWMNLYDCARE
jgi:hypothetical protein